MRGLEAPGARFGKHHLVWLDRLQQVENGEIKRLLGLMPPGSAKSTYTSIVFPVHVMGRFPGAQVLVASYGALLPRKFGRRARGIVRQQVYREIFDAALSKESAAADQFALTNGSEYMGAGILAGITGNRADGIVWDDLIKGRDQAELEADPRQDLGGLYRRPAHPQEAGRLGDRHHHPLARGRRRRPHPAGGLQRRERRHRLPRRQHLACRLHSGRGRARRRRARPRHRRADLAGAFRCRSLHAVQAPPAHLGRALSAASGAGGGRLLQGRLAARRRTDSAGPCAPTAPPITR